MIEPAIPFPETPTRKQMAWAFARTVWGSRADFPQGDQYPDIVAKLAEGFTTAQLQDGIRIAQIAQRAEGTKE